MPATMLRARRAEIRGSTRSRRVSARGAAADPILRPLYPDDLAAAREHLPRVPDPVLGRTEPTTATCAAMRAACECASVNFAIGGAERAPRLVRAHASSGEGRGRSPAGRRGRDARGTWPTRRRISSTAPAEPATRSKAAWTRKQVAREIDSSSVLSGVDWHRTSGVSTEILIFVVPGGTSTGMRRMSFVDRDRYLLTGNRQGTGLREPIALLEPDVESLVLRAASRD